MTPLALVSGVSRGLGRALVKEMAESGWHVIGLSRTEVKAAEGVTVIKADVTDPEVGDVVHHALDGRSLDLLIHNAGVYEGTNAVDDLDAAQILHSVDVHAAAAARLLVAALPSLMRSERPRVVNMSTRLASLERAADRTYAHLDQSLAYRIGKAALNMLTLVAAEALDDTPIEISAVHPGRLQTAMGARDADLTALDGAQKLLNWLDSPVSHHNLFYDLQEDSIIPW